MHLCVCVCVVKAPTMTLTVHVYHITMEAAVQDLVGGAVPLLILINSFQERTELELNVTQMYQKRKL